MDLSFKRLLTLATVFTGAIIAGEIYAHSEPSKARYVAADGQDNSTCDNPLRPCQTIWYAIKQANKGDHIRVAQGKYQVESEDQLFYFSSSIVPIQGGYNRFDHFQTQNPDGNPTELTGIPLTLRENLWQQGFSVVADGKVNINSKTLAAKMSQYSSLRQSKSGLNCTNGKAGAYDCNNLDLVGHVSLEDFSSYYIGSNGDQFAGNDIWGHVDLNTGREYAIMGVRNGVAVFDLSNPENPIEVGTITGPKSTWRDIKVYQFYDSAINTWQAYAYVTVDSGGNGVAIVDLNQLPEKISLAELNKETNTAHNVYVSNVDYTFNIALPDTQPSLQLVGTKLSGGLFRNYSLQKPNTLSYISDIADDQLPTGRVYTHDGTSLLVTDGRKDSQCVNGNSIGCTVFVDFNENSVNIWDITAPTNVKQLGIGNYNDVTENQKYTHSGWWSEDQKFVFVHDEFDEMMASLNTTLRVFNIEDLNNPVHVGQWTGDTKAIDHNGFVRGNRYYMSNYERGVTVLDITDPINPVEVGFFDTYPISNNNNFSGAWGVYPYLPSGLILASDINSGLYILRDNTKSSDQGSLSFTSAKVDSAQGTALNLTVQRNNSAPTNGPVSVQYEFLPGSADSSDFTASKGTLNWAANDVSDKTISINIADMLEGEYKESFLVKLYNPTNGATLGQHSYQQVRLDGTSRSGVVNIENDNFIVAENGGMLTIKLLRTGGSEDSISVDYQVESQSAQVGQDLQLAQGTVTWLDGDVDAKVVTIALTNDEELEDNETFAVRISANGNTQLGNISQAIVTVRDDDSNKAPTIVLDNSLQVNARQSVTINPVVTDAENDDITYLWQQTSGSSATINNAANSSLTFTAPNSAGTLSFELTATDAIGAFSKASVSVTVVKATTSSSNRSGGAGIDYLLIILMALMIRTKNSWLCTKNCN